MAYHPFHRLSRHLFIRFVSERVDSDALEVTEAGPDQSPYREEDLPGKHHALTMLQSYMSKLKYFV